MEHFWEYKLAGLQELALTCDNESVRLEAYRALGFTEEAKKDPYSTVRLEAYRRIGWSREALRDPETSIRLGAYDHFGWTEDALSDREWPIRLHAYHNLGFTEDARNDSSNLIRKEAAEYLDNQRRAPVHFFEYVAAGRAEEAKKSSAWTTVKDAYAKLGWTEDSRLHPDDNIKEEACRALGYTKDDLKSSSRTVRLAAYRTLGWTLGAFENEIESHTMLLEASRALDFPKQTTALFEEEAAEYHETKRILEEVSKAEDLLPWIGHEKEIVRLYASVLLGRQK